MDNGKFFIILPHDFLGQSAPGTSLNRLSAFPPQIMDKQPVPEITKGYPYGLKLDHMACQVTSPEQFNRCNPNEAGLYITSTLLTIKITKVY